MSHGLCRLALGAKCRPNCRTRDVLTWDAALTSGGEYRARRSDFRVGVGKLEATATGLGHLDCKCAGLMLVDELTSSHLKLR